MSRSHVAAQQAAFEVDIAFQEHVFRAMEGDASSLDTLASLYRDHADRLPRWVMLEAKAAQRATGLTMQIAQVEAKIGPISLTLMIAAARAFGLTVVGDPMPEIHRRWRDMLERSTGGVQSN